jgi:hypothetical protein
MLVIVAVASAAKAVETPRISDAIAAAPKLFLMLCSSGLDAGLSENDSRKARLQARRLNSRNNSDTF